MAAFSNSGRTITHTYQPQHAQAKVPGYNGGRQKVRGGEIEISFSPFQFLRASSESNSNQAIKKIA